jgi:nucleoid-associated protein YgaU
MSQRGTHPLHEGADEPSEQADAPREWEHQEEPAVHMLWGRVAALLLALLAAFTVGRLTAPTGASSTELAGLGERLQDARDDNRALQQELDAAQAEADEARAKLEEARAEALPQDTAPAPDEPDEEPARPPGDTYVVQSGDTLQSIATQFYEDASLAHVIAEANGLTDPSLLTPGSELIIPDRPEL